MFGSHDTDTLIGLLVLAATAIAMLLIFDRTRNYP
jgi:hypothetical protein